MYFAISIRSLKDCYICLFIRGIPIFSLSHEFEDWSLVMFKKHLYDSFPKGD